MAAFKYKNEFLCDSESCRNQAVHCLYKLRTQVISNSFDYFKNEHFQFLCFHIIYTRFYSVVHFGLRSRPNTYPLVNKFINTATTAPHANPINASDFSACVRRSGFSLEFSLRAVARVTLSLEPIVRYSCNPFDPKDSSMLYL